MFSYRSPHLLPSAFDGSSKRRPRKHHLVRNKVIRIRILFHTDHTQFETNHRLVNQRLSREKTKPDQNGAPPLYLSTMCSSRSNRKIEKKKRTSNPQGPKAPRPQRSPASHIVAGSHRAPERPELFGTLGTSGGAAAPNREAAEGFGTSSSLFLTFPLQTSPQKEYRDPCAKSSKGVPKNVRSREQSFDTTGLSF